MKKIFIASFLVMFSVGSNAQSAQEVASANIDTTPVKDQSKSIEERIKNQEEEIKALWKDNQELKSQMKQLKTTLFKTNRKVTVSRIGSKQVITE